jgi:Holliday junction resolvase
LRKHGKLDSNHRDIVAALRQAGAFVQSIADIGNGCPDLIVAYHGRVFLIEVKTGAGKLTADEAAWVGECERIGGVSVYLVRSAEDALRAIGAL